MLNRCRVCGEKGWGRGPSNFDDVGSTGWGDRGWEGLGLGLGLGSPPLLFKRAVYGDRSILRQIYIYIYIYIFTSFFFGVA